MSLWKGFSDKCSLQQSKAQLLPVLYLCLCMSILSVCADRVLLSLFKCSKGPLLWLLLTLFINSLRRLLCLRSSLNHKGCGLWKLEIIQGNKHHTLWLYLRAVMTVCVNYSICENIHFVDSCFFFFLNEIANFTVSMQCVSLIYLNSSWCPHYDFDLFPLFIYWRRLYCN